MTNHIDKTVLYDKVTVYNNYLKDTDQYKQLLIDSEFKIGGKYYFNEWKPWYTLGSMMDTNMPDKGVKIQDIYPDNEHALLQKKFMEAAADAFFTTTEDYIKEWGITLPKWQRSALSVCKFVPTPPEKQQYLALEYHTDTHHFNEDSPGNKFAVTCTMYLNDDYEGGEISFLDEVNGKVVKYKPKAGDVIVFPSGQPYFHGTHQIWKGDRYIIRTWWFEDFPGTEEWLENEKKYGKEEWAKMEKERISLAYESGQYHRHVVYPGESSPEGSHSKPFYVKEN